jgi:hypothetical protein
VIVPCRTIRMEVVPLSRVVAGSWHRCYFSRKCEHESKCLHVRCYTIIGYWQRGLRTGEADEAGGSWDGDTVLAKELRPTSVGWQVDVNACELSLECRQ